MNTKKMIAIIFIWLVAAFGWMVLGTVVRIRTDGLLDMERDVARGVEALWGPPQVQKTPTVKAAEGRAVEPFARSEVTVLLDAQNRKRGLGWFPVYDVRFSGAYTVTNDAADARSYTVTFLRPESDAEFTEQVVTVDGREQPEWTDQVQTPTLQPTESCIVTFAYHSKGTESWTYDLPEGEMVRDATVTVRIDQPGYDFGLDGSPPDDRAMTADGEGRHNLVWRKKLVTNARDVTVLMPTRAQPGQLTSRISYFAPISLGFFFVVMIAIQVVRKLKLHPMHYLFLAAAFFAFHLLMAYLVDHVPLHASFWIAAATSVFLVVIYLWLVAGPKAAILYAGLAQLVYLVLFSYSFFLANFTGLTVTVGAVVTLAVLMVLTAKVRWGQEMPELEPRRREGWVPVGDIEAVRPAADDTDAPA